jgi:hypothetical protein
MATVLCAVIAGFRRAMRAHPHPRLTIHDKPSRTLCDPYEIARALRSNSYPAAKIFKATYSSRKGNTNVKLVEPPSCSTSSTIVFIGRNRRGQWVAQQQNGLYGGLFVNRAQALKYALFENGHHPETIIELSREIELEMDDSHRPASRSASGSRSELGRTF